MSSIDQLHVILGNFGCLIVERSGSDVWAFLLSHDILYHHRKNIIVVKQLIYNDISSTKVRLFVRRGMSIKSVVYFAAFLASPHLPIARLMCSLPDRYLLPNSVIHYIMEQHLYQSMYVSRISCLWDISGRVLTDVLAACLLTPDRTAPTSVPLEITPTPTPAPPPSLPQTPSVEERDKKFFVPGKGAVSAHKV
jgi:hypothetical protein